MPADPLRCEPPAEHRGERWHWLSEHGSDPVPAFWDDVYGDQTGLCWQVWERSPMSCDRARQHGYRWIAVAKPPEETKDAE